MSESTDITSFATEGLVGPSKTRAGIPAALACSIGTTIAVVSSSAVTIRFGLSAMAWAMYLTWVPESSVVRATIFTPVAARSLVNCLLNAAPHGLVSP